MESWLPLAILAAIAIALARSLKGLVSWVIWMVALLLTGAAVEAALHDPLLVTGVVVALAAYVAFRIRKVRKARRDKEAQTANGGVHIHNYYPGVQPD